MEGAVSKRWRVRYVCCKICDIPVAARLCRRAAYLYSTYTALACLRSMRDRRRHTHTQLYACLSTFTGQRLTAVLGYYGRPNVDRLQPLILHTYCP